MRRAHQILFDRDVLLHLGGQLDGVDAQVVELRLLVELTWVEWLLGRLPLHDGRRRGKYAPAGAHDGRAVGRLSQRVPTPAVLHIGDAAGEGLFGDPSGAVVAGRRPLVGKAVGPDLEERLGAIWLVEREDVRARAIVARRRQNLGNAVCEGDFVDEMCVRLQPIRAKLGCQR